MRNVDGSNEIEITSTPSAPYLDTFSGDRVDPFWSVGTTGTGPAVAQADGQLEVTLPAGTSFGPEGFANAFAFMTCRLTDDFDMQVDYRLLSGPLPTRVNVGFDAAEFTGESYSGQHGMFVHNPGFGSPGISTHFPDPGVFAPPFNDFIQDTSLSGSLRLVRTTTAGSTTVTASRLSGAPWSFTSQPLRRSEESGGEPQCLHEPHALLNGGPGRLRQLPHQQRHDHMPELVGRQRTDWQPLGK